MMKLIPIKEYTKMSKATLIRKITKALRTLPKAKLAVLCYNITKSKLTQLRTIKQQKLFGDPILDDALRQSDKRIKARARRKTKRGMTLKQKKAINRGRKKAGLALIKWKK